MKEKRKKAEKLILDFMKAIDKTGSNYNHYKNKFSNMSDNEFYNLFKNIKFPIRLHTKGFDNIKMKDIKESLDLLNVPMYESVNLNYIYKDENGNAVQSEPCTVGYIHIPKLRQMNIKKSQNGVDISKTNPKTGELVGSSKVAAITDREFEAMSIFELHNIIKEMITLRSDDIQNFNNSYNAIINKGTVNNDDLDENHNQLSRKNLMISLIGAQIDSNLIDNMEGW